MRKMKFLGFLLISTQIFFSCQSSKKYVNLDGFKSKDSKQAVAKLTSIQIVDTQGISQTISNRDRLEQFEKTDFLSAQPYQKVLRNYSRDSGGSVSSILTSYYPSGQVMQYLEIRGGSASGTYKEWHSNGKTRVEAKVLSGTPELTEKAGASWLFDGRNKAWDEEGHLLADLSYVKGEQHGTSILYHSNGAIWKTLPYTQGKLNGTLQIFLPHGQLLSETPFKQGKREGTAYRYWDKDTLAAIETFENDLLKNGQYMGPDSQVIGGIKEGCGTRIIFSKNGVSEKQQYDQGVQKGLIEYFNDGGELIRSANYISGEKHGEEIEYYLVSETENQLAKRPKLSLQWKHGALQGAVKTWYPNDQLQSQKEMQKNKRHGVHLAYYRNGDMMLMEEYSHDLLVKGSYYEPGSKKPITKVEQGRGLATIFSEDGVPIQEIRYREGSPATEPVRRTLDKFR